MATTRRAVELVRTLRGQAGLKVRQPLARLWLALPGGELPEREALLELLADEVNVKSVELIGDESELVERRVKPLLPRIGKKLGAAIPAVMAAVRAGEFEIHPDGSVTLAGITLAPDEVEILASPRPGTAVAHDDGPGRGHRHHPHPGAARRGRRPRAAAGDPGPAPRGRARPGRSDRGLAGSAARTRSHPFLGAVAADTLADRIVAGPAPAGLPATTVELDGGPVRLALRRVEGRG